MIVVDVDVLLVSFSNIYVIFSTIDLGKKFEKISPKILGIGTGNAYDVRKTLTHMRNNVPKRIFNDPEVIHEVGKCGVNWTKRIDVKETTCYVAGVQSQQPTIYKLDDGYNDILGKRATTLNEYCESLIAAGSGYI